MLYLFFVLSYFIFDFLRRVFWSLIFSGFAFPLRVLCMHFEFCRFGNDIKFEMLLSLGLRLKFEFELLLSQFFGIEICVRS